MKTVRQCKTCPWKVGADLDCIPGDKLPSMFGADPTLGAKLVHRRATGKKIDGYR